MNKEKHDCSTCYYSDKGARPCPFPIKPEIGEDGVCDAYLPYDEEHEKLFYVWQGNDRGSFSVVCADRCNILFETLPFCHKTKREAIIEHILFLESQLDVAKKMLDEEEKK